MFYRQSRQRKIVISGRLMKKQSKGKTYVIFTSLTELTDYSHSAIFDLYLKRWAIEECYKTLKNNLELADWTSTNINGVLQDFKSKILLHNLGRILSCNMTPNRKKKYPENKKENAQQASYKQPKRKRIISFSTVLGQTKSLLRLVGGTKTIIELINYFRKQVKSAVQYSRKGQSSPRNYWEARKYHINQKHA